MSLEYKIAYFLLNPKVGKEVRIKFDVSRRDAGLESF
jgi:hypothetical protein